MSIGLRLRHARLAKRLTLKDVADRVGCSESMVSKVENDKTTPSIAMLHRLASAVDANVSMLFEQQNASEYVLRANERPILDDESHTASGVRVEWLTHPAGPALFQASIHVVEPGASSDGAIVHDGEDFGLVLEGTVAVTIDDDSYTLGPGDSFAFPSRLPHSYSNDGDSPAKIVWMNTPPTF
jgi:transcriptional regulator with XRE-family HTH domain